MAGCGEKCGQFYLQKAGSLEGMYVAIAQCASTLGTSGALHALPINHHKSHINAGAIGQFSSGGYWHLSLHSLQVVTRWVTERERQSVWLRLNIKY